MLALIREWTPMPGLGDRLTEPCHCVESELRRRLHVSVRIPAPIKVVVLIINLAVVGYLVHRIRNPSTF